MPLERSTVARSAKSVFFEDVNDIDIFVEDTAIGYEKLLTLVFSKRFEGKYNVGKVFPLGSRKEVVKTYKADIEKIARPTLYVVDGDLFILSGDTVTNNIGFYKLPFYCFENLICKVQPILEVLNEEDNILYLDELKEKFNYSQWENDNINLLFSLFIVYAATMVLKPSVQTVGYEVKNLVADGKGNISEIKLNRRIEELKSVLIDEFGEDCYHKVVDEIHTRFTESGYSKLDVISGKDYIFPLLKVRIRSTVKTSMTDLNLKMRLACKVSLDSLGDCENFVALPKAG
ncbi:DUF4435 domain-containing protein [Vibrio parahaemolyticus]|nr:DUF4435 domain-containing protein [Vibrio parahaemolyticus]HCE2446268.1 DUF4435 domain-containing protein [Vibrio parahaemolyticus]